MNVDLLQADFEQFTNGVQFQTNLLPLNMLVGTQIDFYRLLTWMENKTVKNVEDIITRLRLFSQRTDKIISLLIFAEEEMSCLKR